MLKLPRDLCVCAPQYRELSTSIGPNASVSVLVLPAILLVDVLKNAVFCKVKLGLDRLVYRELDKRGEMRKD